MSSGGLTVKELITGYQESPILQGLTFEALPGKVLGFAGGNGSGKSTLLRCLAGLLPVWSGEVWFGSNEISTLGVHDRSTLGICYLPQEPRIFRRLSARDNILIVGRASSSLEVSRHAERLIDDLPWLRARIYSPAGEFSGGEQSIIAICRILVQQPKLLLLDEPMVGISERNSIFVKTQLKHLTSCGSCIICTDHTESVLGSWTDQIFRMDSGKMR